MIAASVFTACAEDAINRPQHKYVSMGEAGTSTTLLATQLMTERFSVNLAHRLRDGLRMTSPAMVRVKKVAAACI